MSTTTATLGTANHDANEDFGRPVYLDEGEAAGVAVDTASATIPETINLDNPDLLAYEVAVNQVDDPYAVPPPLPDGRWLAKLRHREQKNSRGESVRYQVKIEKDADGLDRLVTLEGGRQVPDYTGYTAHDALILDQTGKYDGIALTDYYVSTRPNPRKGNAIPACWILGCLKVQLPTRIGITALMDAYFKALLVEPTIEIDTVWEGSPDQNEQERIVALLKAAPAKKFFQQLATASRGQHRWPQNAKGEYLPDRDVETAHGKIHLHARPRINGYFPVGSAKASGLAYGPHAR